MNCKQVEKLLPLYVSRDLEAERGRSVTAHLESCAACSAAAGEYQQTRQLLQEYAPPAFSEGVYAAMRQNVWREIESKSGTRSQWEVFIGMFRPRLTWASAAVVLITVSVFGIYLIANRLSVPHPIAVTAPTTNPQTPVGGPPPQTQEGTARVPPISSNDVPKEQSLAGRRKSQRRTHRNVFADRASSVAAARSASSLTADTSSDLKTAAQSDDRSDNNSANTLRMEIQTKNPNIRIIWFAQRDTKRVSPNSKGI